MSDAAAVAAGADLRVVLRDALESGKAIEIVELPTGEQSGGMFDWMLIATATSSRHAVALAERLRRAQKKAGLGAAKIEGERAGEWILLDSGAVVAHIMSAEARERYDLESLWRFEK